MTSTEQWPAGQDRPTDLDEAARRETSLRVSEPLLRATFEQAALGLAHVALDGRWLRVNAKLCDIMGYSREEIVRLTFQDLTHPDDLDENLALKQRLIDGEIPTYHMEKRYIRKDGATIWANLTVSLVRDGEGRPHFFFSVVEDITERKKAQEALRESEQRLSIALEAGRLGSWELDLLGGSFTASDTCKAYFGREPTADFTFEDLQSAVHGDDEPVVRQTLARAIATGKDCQIEFRNLWPDGSTHWIQLRGQAVLDGAARPMRMVGVVLDVTEGRRAEEGLHRLNEILEERVRERTRQLESEIDERRRAEEALRASEARYAAVFEHTTASILLLSVEPGDRFVCEAVNPTHLRATGRTLAEYLGTTAYDLYPHELAERITARYRQCIASGGPVIYEDAFDYPTGKRVMQGTVVAIRDADGRVGKLLISTRDITEQKQAEEALRQSQKMEAIGQLTGGVAHDFNNLLTALLGNLERLAARVTGAKEVEFLQGAMQAAQRGAKLTEQLLAFARKQHLQLESIRLDRLITGIRNMLEITIGATVRIEIILGDDLWPALVDANQIELVILNLAINARDAMPAGGVLTIRAENRGAVGSDSRDYVVLSVGDTGLGMTEEVRMRAFEPFFTTKEPGKGSGLGLSQVYGIVRQLGGHVEIDSAPAKGTTIRVYLPRAAKASAEPVHEAAPPSVADDARAKILVVDDDRHVRDLVVSCLVDSGHEVVAAPDGQAALDLLSKGLAVDLLVTDFAMPERRRAGAARTPLPRAASRAVHDRLCRYDANRCRGAGNPHAAQALQGEGPRPQGAHGARLSGSRRGQKESPP